MESLISSQGQLGKEIERLTSNYGKDSSDRKTQEYLEKKTQQLEEVWRTFEENDVKLQIYKSEQPEHRYFVNKYYETILCSYQKVKDDINHRLTQLKASSVQGLQPPNIKPGASTHQEEVDTVAQSLHLRGLMRKQNGAMSSLNHLIANLRALTEGQPKRYYEVKINAINEHWAKITQLNESICDIADSADVYTTEFLDMETKVHDVLIALMQKLDEQPNIAQPSTPAAQMKLPKITLPKFDGDYLKWQAFHDLFIQMIHQQSMGNAQKMWFLKTNLTGEAERLIKHLPISDDSYTTAWEILKHRYDNKRLLTTALLDRLLNQPSIANESSSAIKRFHDTTKECILALTNMGIYTYTWDPILMHLLLKKIDKTTHGLYEQGLQDPRELPTTDGFLDFLETRFQSLEALGRCKFEAKSTPKSSALVTSSSNTKARRCTLCNRNHPLYSCTRFLQLAPAERFNTAQRLKLCTNCLKGTHSTSECSSRSCLKCQRRHNTLLHEGASSAQGSTSKEASRGKVTASGSNGDKITSDNPVTLAVETTQPKRNYVLLGTVTVKVINQKGKETECRALLDSGSQLNFVTEKLARKMGLKGVSESMYIQGIGESKQRSQNRVNIELKSRINGFTTRLEAFTLPQITSPQPSYELDIATWPIPQNIELADPRFNQPGHIDILIGAELYYQLQSIGQIKLGTQLPTLQNTVFGWIVVGSVHGTPLQQGICGVSTSEAASLEEQMERFWKMEEVHATPTPLTVQEAICENHFAQTTKRGRDGRFVVRLPFIQQPDCLGESSDIAFRRLISMEKKLGRNEDLRLQYNAFMKEYLDLGHMREIDSSTLEKPYCFLPHHAVIKPESSTTKLRVVFDASAKTSSNVALNNILGTGPTLQDDLFTILLRFRTPRFVITADIEKMYRQIMVHPEDCRYQLILWRDNPANHVKCYELKTVTYGTTSAPYLATKCLQSLALQSATKFPLGSSAIKRDFYVDDLMTGANSLVETLQTQTEVKEILHSAGFNLRKWCSNHPQLLQNIPREERALQLDIHEAEDSIKTLGLTWLPKTDEFSIRVSWPENERVTKRTVLSDIARLFDPLGIMSPVVVTAKIFLQQLWHLKLDWDASLPMELHTTWTRFRQSLSNLNEIKIPRHTFAGIVPDSIQIHAFSDASEKAYGAAVYLRSTGPGGAVIVRLLCARSRVAPIKTITLPRLELCAAKLSAELVTRIKTDLKLDVPCFYWSDSEIVLAWINSQPSFYPTFVANRITSIQELTTANQWHHVRSRENPADIVSRGLDPEKLPSYTLWFYGPIFLHGSEKLWPPPFTKKDPELERKVPKTALAATQETSHFMHSIDHKNNFNKWQRIVAYTLRFVNNCNKRTTHAYRTGHLSIEELNDSLTVMIKEVQRETFKDELRQLQQTGHVSSTSFICSLSPFLDKEGIIRVGGRLEASELPFEAKHPMLIPKTHPLTRLLLTQIHLQNLHAAPQALLAITRQRFWPVQGKTVARSVVQNCVKCAKAKPKLLSQFMGDLPVHRVQQARPFINAGVDFFGPCWIHFKSRGKRPQKAYVAVFCCFATKATHLEVVSDLTSTAFIGALRRFTGRRGNCRNMYCDNATNFVGAKNQLAELKDVLYAEKSQQKISEFCISKGIEFHFIPPRAPHFGGLWEAAVKSAKHILQRNIASASLTYEELETLMVEIEAVLNSRPLTPTSSDPNDLSALTPGHFLIGEPTTTIIDPVAQPPRVSLLQRWKLVTHLKNQFWLRWSHEYLSELQHRHKWKQQCRNVQPGTMVVIKEDNLPVTTWRLGRIIKTIKGNDGLVRVADVRTTSGILRRPIHNLAPLPVINDELQPDQQPNEKDPPQSRDNPDQGHKNRGKHKAPTEARGSSASEVYSPATLTPESSSRTKKPRRGITALSMVLMALLILPASSQVEITPFKTPPGLYFENMGQAHLVSNEWSLVIYYNMSSYWKELGIIKEGIARISDICATISETIACEPTVQEFLHVVEEVEGNNEVLLHSNEGGARIKRAPLNIIGNVASSLFGVLDSEYAKNMENVIENLKVNDHQLFQLLKNQTSIIDSTTNIMKRTQEAMDERFSSFKIHLNNVIMQINEADRDMKIHQTFISAALNLMLVITNYQRIQSTLLDVIIDTHHGKINPQLLKPRQLHKQLTVIQEHLPSSLRLPGKPDDLLKLYSLMTVEGRVAQNQIIFRARLPLFSYEQYELLRIIPVPFPRNDTYMVITSVHKYLIVNLHRDHYYPISDQELQACLISDTNFICRQHHPLYSKGSGVGSCEISVISQWPFATACEASPVSDPPRWIQLINHNQWIYLIPTKTTVNIVCGTTVSQETIEGSGILQLQANCALKDALTTIHGHNIYSSVVKGGFIPSRNLTEFVKPSTPINVSFEVTNNDNIKADIQRLQTKISELRIAEDVPATVTTHDTHQFAIGYMCLLFIMMIAAYLGWKCKSSEKWQAPPKTPAPRPRAPPPHPPNAKIDIEEQSSYRSTRGECSHNS